jgi:hypothetical protein
MTIKARGAKTCKEEVWTLRLYVAGQMPKCMAAFARSI